MKPWDIQSCTKDCSGNVINMHPVMNSADGYEYLTYDDMYFTLSGNGYTPDISLYDGASTGNTVHSVYTNQFNSDYVTIDGVADLDSTATDGFINTPSPLFKSAADCGSDGYSDYASGYASSTGTVSAPVTDIFRDEVYEYLGIDVPPSSVSTGFLYISGIQDGSTGTRHDCGCLVASCDSTGDDDECGLTLEWGPDFIELDQIVSIDDSIGCGTSLFNNSIPSFLETV